MVVNVKGNRILLFFILFLLFVPIAGCHKKKARVPERRTISRDVLPDSLSGRILFSSFRTGNSEIYIIDKNGVKRLTDNPALDERPIWSPDGRYIAFVSDRDGNKEIYIMDSDGKNQRRLTFNSWNDENPSWSPDGRSIVFDSGKGGVTNLYIIDVDGKNLRRLTDYSIGQVAGIPSWSPDGKNIAFTSNKWLGYQVSVIGIDGRGEKRLTNKGGNCEPIWSPDGKEIAFVNRNGRSRIWLMEADGSNKRQISDGPRQYDYNPSWSPDGRKIAYMSTDDPYDARRGEIFVINLLTSERIQITYEMASSPTWHE